MLVTSYIFDLLFSIPPPHTPKYTFALGVFDKLDVHIVNEDKIKTGYVVGELGRKQLGKVSRNTGISNMQ